MYFVYILRSFSSQKSYIGCANNLLRRYREHSRGEEKATRNRGPWEMIHWEMFECLADARKREQFLKTGFGYTWRKKNNLI